jgi:hypothetical protein
MESDIEFVDHLRLVKAKKALAEANEQLDLVWEVIQLKRENARLRKIEDQLVQAGHDRLASDLSFCVATGRIPIAKGVFSPDPEPESEGGIA